MFEEICSFENLLSAYYKARKCKRYRNEVLRFSYHLEKNLFQLQGELLSQKYRHGRYREFIVCDSKKRNIKAAPFRDRIAHHALCNIIAPIFENCFISDSYACRKEKGLHRAIKKTTIFLRSALARIKTGEMQGEKIYGLQCDISKYFDSVNHKILFDIIMRKITNERTLWLIKIILDSSCKSPGVGIPIGNLTSQLFANVYLNELDQFAKHKLRLRYYLRYMDDFLVLDIDKNKLEIIKKQMQKFVSEKLALRLPSEKANIFPVEKGIDFLGYRIFKNYRFLRKSTVRRFIKRSKFYQKKLEEYSVMKEKFGRSLRSWTAYAEFGNSWKLRQKLNYIYGFFG